MNTTRELQQAWHSRTEEIRGYETEASLHAATLAASTNDEWPDRLLAFKGADRARIIAECPTADVATVQALTLRDRARGAAAEVAYELTVCQQHLVALETLLPLADRTKPLSVTEAGIAHMEALRIAGTITAWEIDESTIRMDDGTLSAGVVITNPDASKKRRVVTVNGTTGEVVFVHSSKAV
jgi:hypothetical protein